MNQQATPFKWTQSSLLGRDFELSDGSGNILGRLQVTKLLGQKATGEYSGKRFGFHYTGILRPMIRMSNESDETVATVRLRWKIHLKAEIELANGRRYRMLSFGAIGRNWELRDEEDRELCTLVEKWGVMRSSGVFNLTGVRGLDPEPGFLALLMWYISLMIRYQESAVAAGGGA